MTIKTTLIALSAAAAMALSLAPSAQAGNVNLNFGVDLGDGIYLSGGTGHVGHDYYPDDDCFYKKVKKVKWHNHGGFMHKHVTWKKKLVCY
jgi:hypothetical protein